MCELRTFGQERSGSSFGATIRSASGETVKRWGCFRWTFDVHLYSVLIEDEFEESPFPVLDRQAAVLASHLNRCCGTRFNLIGWLQESCAV